MMFTPISLLIASATVVGLMFLHELAHYVSARALQLRVISYGIRTQSQVPHPYVEVGWTPDRKKRTLYMMAGVMTTLTLFSVIFIATGFWLIPGLYLGFCIQLILETNPLFSDFTLLRNLSKGNGPNSQGDEMFTTSWYIHFIIWAGLVILLLSPRFLPGLLFSF